MHEDYNNTLLSNDIAVLKLSGSITRSNKVTTICLPASKDSISDVYDKDVVVAGWYVKIKYFSVKLINNWIF